MKFIYYHTHTFYWCVNMGVIREAWNKLAEDVKRTWVLKFEDEDEKVLFLSNALAGEVGELANEVKKWFRLRLIEDEKNIPKQQLHVSFELMDILYYVVMMASTLGIDVEGAWDVRLEQNEKRWRELKKRGQL